MKVFNPQWNRDMDVSDRLASYMAKAGYEPWHTGGGCMAWRKDEDKDGNAYRMITFIDVELGNWKDRDDPQWVVGRYVWTDVDESWVCCEDGLTLARAVEVGDQLPAPKPNQQRIVPAKDLNRPQWLHEFSEAYRPNQVVLDLLNDVRVSDQSWHNDVAPHFEAKARNGLTVELWFYRADPNDRADEGDSIPADQPQYGVAVVDHTGYGNRAPTGENLDTNDADLAVLTFKQWIERKRPRMAIAMSEARDKRSKR